MDVLFVESSEDTSRGMTLCDAEPITRLERIQSFGMLLAMNRKWIIVRTSVNLRPFIGIDPVDALGQALDALVDPEALHDIRNRMLGLPGSGGIERLYGIELIHGRPALDLAIHYVGDLCVIEGELAGSGNAIDAASMVRKMVARLRAQPSLDAFHREAARQVRSLTGFDRVMIYRFATDASGEVIAEAAKDGLESFMGLNYPASDIPIQARALYLRSPFRIIADVAAPTVPLTSGRDSGCVDEPLDLSLAITRAVSTVHIEYLRNMHVGASLSISIIVEGSLWGLIACHHQDARLPSFATRTAAELLGQMYSMSLESRLHLLADHQDRHMRESVARLVKAVAENMGLLDNVGWLHDAVREMIPCDGVAVTRNGALCASGTTPEPAYLDACVRWLNHTSPRAVFATDRLSSLPLHPTNTGTAAGLLSIPISSSPGDYILTFRRELSKDVRWAGASSKAVDAAGETKPLTPRTSFKVFVEAVRDRSRPFTESEQRAADGIRSGLLELVLRGSVQAAREQAQTPGSQELLIAELNHRVRNVLSLIRGLISQTHGEGGGYAAYVESLNGRIQALARAHDRVCRRNWEAGPLNAVFDDEIAAFVPTRRDRFIIEGPVVRVQPLAYSSLALVVHELVTNSSKYGALRDNGRVRVTLNVLAGQGLRFSWRESDGPPVQAPARRGFGSVIIERVIPFDLQGTASVTYSASGLQAEFLIPERFLVLDEKLPAGSILDSSAEMTAAAGSRQNSRPLDGLRVLVVEDNLIVALEAENLLRGLGAMSIVAVSSSTAAMQAFHDSAIDFAVLDINLGFETSLGFAAHLRASKVPFIFASGYGQRKFPGDAPVAELVVSKPYDGGALCAAVTATLAGSR